MINILISKSIPSLILFLFSALLIDQGSGSSDHVNCPPNITIVPCTCESRTSNSPSIYITCSGNQVSQASVTRVLAELRRVNKVTPIQWLSLQQFEITYTRLTRLDLTPFMRTLIRDFYMYSNCQLTSIAGPNLNSPANTGGLIKVSRIGIFENFRLGDEGIGQSLKYFADNLEYLDLTGNNLRGSKLNSEFLPGLGRFSKLYYLSLINNKITKLEGGQFKKNVHNPFGLTLHLANNKIVIGKDAFVSEPNSTFLRIDFTKNKLSDENFNGMDQSGLLDTKNRAGASMRLLYNNFNTLSYQNFGKYLQSSIYNIIDLQYNNITCDHQVKWIRDGKADYEKKILNANCCNQKGKTLFTFDS